MCMSPMVLGGLLPEYRVTEIAVLVFDRTFVTHYLMHVGSPRVLGDKVTVGCRTWIVVGHGVAVPSVYLGFQSFDPMGDLSGVIGFLQQVPMVGFHMKQCLLFGHDGFVATPLTLPHVVEDASCHNSRE